MASKKKRINVKHPERSFLTDTVPYELPLFFTNANLAIAAFMARTIGDEHKLHNKVLLSIELSPKPTKPYLFGVKRNSGPPRKLALAHPKSQHLMCKFYADYEHFVCNACSRSNYSLRYPSRVATHYVDPRYAVKVDPKHTSADEDPVGFRDQSKWASTYFSYRDYSLAYRFFDSDEFLTLERRFAFLMRLDISRCFDSIYTHSIEWSMRGKAFSKEHLPGRGKKTFESEFDSTIRHGNWNETHGIIVGPEFSRVFAEVVLQAADRSIREIARSLAGHFEIRRYVDDYFIFADSKDVLEKVKNVIRGALGELNLHLNESKTKLQERPFVSKLSAARANVAAALDTFSNIALPLAGCPGDVPDERRIEQARRSLITAFRRIAVELDVSYDKLSSFAFSVLNKHVSAAAHHAKTLKPDLTAGHLSRLSWLISIVRFGQFLFAIDERVTTSVKLARLYSTVVQVAEELKCARGPIEGQILDGLRGSKPGTSKEGIDEIARINHVCVVDMLMTENRRLDVSDLQQYLGYSNEESALSSVSIFQLLAMLFVSRRRHRFSVVRSAAKKEIERRLSLPSQSYLLDAETAYLLTDYVACPHIDTADKREIIKRCYKQVFGSNCTDAQADEIVTRSGWITFTDWSGASDLSSMLARKELTPAYE